MPIPVRRYCDLDMSFLPHPVTGDLVLIKDELAIGRAIKNLVLTDFYERQYRPELGSGVTHKLFDNMNVLTKNQIKKAVEDVIKNYEPRADLLGVVVVSDIENHGIEVSISYYPENQVEPVSIKVFLERVR